MRNYKICTYEIIPINPITDLYFNFTDKIEYQTALPIPRNSTFYKNKNNVSVIKHDINTIKSKLLNYSDT